MAGPVVNRIRGNLRDERIDEKEWLHGTGQRELLGGARFREGDPERLREMKERGMDI